MSLIIPMKSVTSKLVERIQRATNSTTLWKHLPKKMATFCGGYRIALGASKLFKLLVINFRFLLIKRFTKSFCPVFVPGHDRLKFY